MKRILLLAGLAAAGCGDAPDLSIPPVALGSGGGRILTGDAKTPAEAYENAFGSMTKLHLQLHEGLRPPNNLTAVKSALNGIVANLETMQALVVEEERDRFTKILREYTEWQRARSTGGLASQATELERQIRINLGPSKMTLVAALPGATAALPKDPVKPNDPPLIPTKTDPPAKTEEPKKPDPVAGKDLSAWMIFAAWKQSHADLVAAYTKKGDWQTPLGRATECLKAMKPRLSEEAQNTLMVYLKQYESIEKTIARGGSEARDEFILKDLAVVSSLIENGFNPDNKK